VSSVRTAAVLVFAAVAAALPRAAEACAVCMSGREDDTQRAFLLGTLLLSALPLVLIGGLILWLRRRARDIAAREAPLSPGAVAKR
jgi:hypothetical protein